METYLLEHKTRAIRNKRSEQSGKKGQEQFLRRGPTTKADSHPALSNLDLLVLCNYFINFFKKFSYFIRGLFEGEGGYWRLIGCYWGTIMASMGVNQGLVFMKGVYMGAIGFIQ